MAANTPEHLDEWEVAKNYLEDTKDMTLDDFQALPEDDVLAVCTPLSLPCKGRLLKLYKANKATERRVGQKGKRTDDDAGPSNKRRRSGGSEPDLPEQVPLNAVGEYVAVQRTDVAGFGDAQERRLFVREEVKEQWRAMEKAANTGRNLRVSGPPGTGKSTTAWAWALWKATDKGAKATWFHNTANGVSKVVVDGTTKKLVATSLSWSNVTEAISEAEGDILLFDGVTKGEYKSVASACVAWRKQCNGRSFVLVSSVAVAVAVQEDKEVQIDDHTVASWTLEQYVLACDDDGFYNDIKAKLKVPGAPDDKQALLRLKYYYAGACARWMFEFDLEEFQKDFAVHLGKVADYLAILGESGGDTSLVAVNHLRAVTFDVDGKKKFFFVSEYAMEQLAQKCDDKRKFIVDSYAKAEATENPAYKGWIFEFDIDYQVNQAFAEEKLIQATVVGVKEEWKVDKYITFDTVQELKHAVGQLGNSQLMWAKPKLWCQKAYDFLRFWRAGNELHMVAANATVAKSHGVLLDVVNALARDLGNVSRIRFDFIVPTGSALNVGNPTGRLCDWQNLSGEQWPNSPNGQEYRGNFVIVAAVAPTE